jgi:hypothetical protein
MPSRLAYRTDWLTDGSQSTTLLIPSSEHLKQRIQNLTKFNLSWLVAAVLHTGCNEDIGMTRFPETRL